MRRDRRYIRLDTSEHRLLIFALNKMRNRLIGEHRPTDVVDELLMKVIDAPVKK